MEINVLRTALGDGLLLQAGDKAAGIGIRRFFSMGDGKRVSRTRFHAERQQSRNLQARMAGQKMNPPEEPGPMCREDQAWKSRGKSGQKSQPGGEGGYAHRRLTRQTGQNRGSVAGEQEKGGRYNVRPEGNSLPDLIRASKSPTRGKPSGRPRQTGRSDRTGA